MTALLAPGPPRWRRMAAVLAFVLLFVLNAAFTLIVQRQMEMKLCRVTEVVGAGPTTPQQREGLERLRRFRDDLDC